MEKEDFLISQIDEFREKARQLQGLLASRESKAKQLQEIVEEREGKAKELSDKIGEQQDAADRVVEGVGAQIDDMLEKVDARIKEMNRAFAERLAENEAGSAEQAEAAKEMIREHDEKLSETIGGLSGLFDKLKSEVCEKVHTENVQCYRNMQTLIEETDGKIEGLQEEVAKLSSFKTMFAIIIFITVLNVAGLAGVIARIFGLI